MNITSIIRTTLLVLSCNIALSGCCHLLKEDAPTPAKYSVENKEMNAIYHFAFDRSELSEQDMPALNEFATFLHANPSMKAHVDGYTDAQGPYNYNLNLGLRRAEAVAEYLQAKGVPAERIEVNSYGKDKLVDEAYTLNAHAKNRRAVIYVTEEKAVV